jgi:hypothetical protein
MNMKSIKVLSVISILSLSQVATAGIEWSGYGSIAVGAVVGGQKDVSGEKEFQSDFYDYAYYTEDYDFRPDSMLGLQGNVDLSDGASLTFQIVAKGADEFKPDLDWIYLSYQLSDDLKLMAGRRNLPMYYFSESMEVGYAAPWIRPPANLYWWEITQFNGLTLTKSMEVGDWEAQLSGFVGRENQEDIKSHDYWRNRGGYYAPPEGTYIAGTSDVEWSDIMGINLGIANEWADIRISYFATHYSTTADIMLDANSDGIPEYTNADGSPLRSGKSDVTDFDLSFLGLSGNFMFEQVSVLIDYNFVSYDDAYQSEFPTYLVLVTFNSDTYQPYAGFTKASGKITKDVDGYGVGDAEEHQMLTLGLRYNFHPSASLKVQYDDFQDLGDKSSFGDLSYHNDAQLVSASIDFIF